MLSAPHPGSITTTLPPSIAKRMWETNAPATRVDGVSFWEFLTLDELDAPRPKSDGLNAKPNSTASAYFGLVRQALREVGVNVDSAEWWNAPPPWADLYAWRSSPKKGGAARLESHRKALLWYAAYWNQLGEGLPFFMRETWETAKRVEHARKLGTMKKYPKHFRLPDDIGALLSSHPYADSLRRTKMWSSEPMRAEAAYLDDLFHVAVGQGFANGWRPQDYPQIELRAYDAAQGRIIGHGQGKKYGAERDLTAPEDWPWHADGRWFPSLDWYVQSVRPRVAREREADDARLFLQWDGQPYFETTFRNFLSTGIHLVLGPDVPGPHGLRRACATWRYRHGTTIDDVAALIGDTPAVTERSYINRGWIGRVGRWKERDGLPRVPVIRPNGQRLLRGATGEKENGAVPPILLSREKRPGRDLHVGLGLARPTGPPENGLVDLGECNAKGSSDEDEPPSSFDQTPQLAPYFSLLGEGVVA